jgi:hypothetical protein
VTESRSGSSFSEGRNPERRSGTFFPGIGIINTTPLPTNFGSLYVPESFSKEKIYIYTHMPLYNCVTSQASWLFSPHRFHLFYRCAYDVNFISESLCSQCFLPGSHEVSFQCNMKSNSDIHVGLREFYCIFDYIFPWE